MEAQRKEQRAIHNDKASREGIMRKEIWLKMTVLNI